MARVAERAANVLGNYEICNACIVIELIFKARWWKFNEFSFKTDVVFAGAIVGYGFKDELEAWLSAMGMYMWNGRGECFSTFGIRLYVFGASLKVGNLPYLAFAEVFVNLICTRYENFKRKAVRAWWWNGKWECFAGISCHFAGENEIFLRFSLFHVGWKVEVEERRFEMIYFYARFEKLASFVVRGKATCG